jgi:CheY-like chemotaxis protein
MLYLLWEDVCEINDFTALPMLTSNEQALRYLESDPDVTGAILDYNLSDGTSEPTAARLRQMNIPIIISSGSSSDALPGDYLDMPVIMKPYRPPEMYSALARLLASSPNK